MSSDTNPFMSASDEQSRRVYENGLSPKDRFSSLGGTSREATMIQAIYGSSHRAFEDAFESEQRNRQAQLPDRFVLKLPNYRSSRPRVSK